MTPERWQQVKVILEQAVELEPTEQAAFVKTECLGDGDLLREVESLLSHNNTRANCLDGAALASIVASDPALNLNEYVGKEIGHYRIVRELGAGGMGTVFLAERADGAFEQQVALKLIKRGMDSEAILKGFFTELQILASLEHPNIAHLIDGGTTADGLPFFVMEYVEGETIVDFVARHGLDLDAKLRLFRHVCSAVTYAHQNLVIHRDLKPSNILVGKDGTPKLLDFGIAKLLKSDISDGESTRNFIFTPEYASPEQVRSDKITTATDVYSLGVILYELLTGDRPYKAGGRNIGEVIRAICETEPERPSSIVSRPKTGPNDTEQIRGKTKEAGSRAAPQALRGDLDNIILKALRKEPERRYSSVEQFSDDIKRHLEGLPVLATKDTWGYRASKFVSRNRVGAAAAGLVLITLIAGMSATLYQANVARNERLKAEQRFNDVRQLANSFLFEFHDAIENLSGSTPARKLVVSRAVEYLDKLAAESAGDPALQRELGTAYEKIGKIQGNSYFSNLGDTDGAMKSYTRSLEIRQALADADPENREIQYELAISHRGVGDIHYTVNDLRAGLQSYENSLAILDRLAAAEPENIKFRSSLADILSRRGDIQGMEGYPNLGDIPGALESYRRVVTLAEGLLASEPNHDEYKGDYATRLFYLARLQTATGDSKGAIVSGQKSIEILDSLAKANPDNAEFRTRTMAAIASLRPALLNEGRTDEAVANAKRVIETMVAQAAADTQNAQTRRSLGVSYSALADCLLQAGDVAGSLENYRRSVDISSQLAAGDPKNAENRQDIAIAKRRMAEAQIAAGDHSGALANLQQSISIVEAIMQQDDADANSLQDLAIAHYHSGRAFRDKGDLTNSADSFRKAIKFGEEYLKKNPHNVGFRTRHALAFYEAGKPFLLVAQKQNADARAAAIAESCGSLRQSSDILNELKTAGTLGVIYTDRPGLISKDLAQCG